MKRFIIDHSDEEFHTSTAGIPLVGFGVNRCTYLASSIAKAVPLFQGISHADVIRSFCGCAIDKFGTKSEMTREMIISLVNRISRDLPPVYHYSWQLARNNAAHLYR